MFIDMQHTGTEEKDPNEEYQKSYANAITITRKVTVFNRILRKMEGRIDDIGTKLKACQFGEGDYNPGNCFI